MPHRLTLDIKYMGLPWAGSFTLAPDVTEKTINMSCDGSDGPGRPLQVSVRAERRASWRLFLHAQHWLINKTQLPLQLKGQHSDIWYELTDEPVLWRASGRSNRASACRVRLRAHHSATSRRTPLAAAAPGLVVCSHSERRTDYRLLLCVSTQPALCVRLRAHHSATSRRTPLAAAAPGLVVCSHSERRTDYRLLLCVSTQPALCVRLWAHHSATSRRTPLAAAAPGLVVCSHSERRTDYRLLLCVSTQPALCVPAPGLVVCSHSERRTDYRLLLCVTLSELCPQLTKIVTLLPYFVVYNDTRRHLRFMEENEAADLWLDLAPQQCAPFWPQTDSMMMHCKFRDSCVISQHFPITKNHFTVLRMDKGESIKHLNWVELQFQYTQLSKLVRIVDQSVTPVICVNFATSMLIICQQLYSIMG
ncbi:uncharacterized protein LOC114366398 [Ostrinia furnacalis]|uniref:uncharacterized protein LOC114366398 n=1 Tax=Ostrinia furnacalis TaxID=93504 RepID=UPI001039C4E1|nr:uncharacterized protein LOC114366398 [Ostrinia furnacalis]